MCQDRRLIDVLPLPVLLTNECQLHFSLLQSCEKSLPAIDQRRIAEQKHGQRPLVSRFRPAFRRRAVQLRSQKMTHETQQHRVAMGAFHVDEPTIGAEARVSGFQFSAERRIVQSAHVQNATDCTLEQPNERCDQTEEGVEKDVEVEKDHEGATIVER